MPDYVYRGRNKAGEYVFGTIESPNLTEAIQLLKSSHRLSIIFDLKDRRKAPFAERIELLKKSVTSVLQRVSGQFKGSLDSIANIQREHRMSKVLNLVQRLNKVDVSITRGLIDRGAQETVTILTEGPPASRPEFKKRPVKRRELTEGYAIAWEAIKSPAKSAVHRLRISSKDVRLFTRRLALLLSSGVSIANALQTFLEHMEGDKLRRMVQSIYEDIQNGYSLSYALLRFPKQFSRLYIAMVIVGETSGALDRCLLDMADYLDTQQKITQSIKSASIYPRIVIILLLALMVAGAKFFVPMFEEMFVEFEMPLPVLTQAIFWVANSLIYILPIMILSLLVIYMILRIPVVGNEYLYRRDGLLLRLPVVGELVMSMSMFHFSHTLSVMLGNGVRLLDSLVMARDVVANKVLQHEVHDAMEQVVEGVNLSEALYRQRTFDPLVSSMIYTGEESGAMDRVLEQTSDHYLKRVKEQVEIFVQWVQPMSILLLAAVVIPVVLGIYLPLLDITSGQFMN